MQRGMQPAHCVLLTCRRMRSQVKHTAMRREWLRCQCGRTCRVLWTGSPERGCQPGEGEGEAPCNQKLSWSALIASAEGAARATIRMMCLRHMNTRCAFLLASGRRVTHNHHHQPHSGGEAHRKTGGRRLASANDQGREVRVKASNAAVSCKACRVARGAEARPACRLQARAPRTLAAWMLKQSPPERPCGWGSEACSAVRVGVRKRAVRGSSSSCPHSPGRQQDQHAQQQPKHCR